MADALPRLSIAQLQFFPRTDLTETVVEQLRTEFPNGMDVSGLQLEDIPLTAGDDILCNVSTDSHCPFVLSSLRRKVVSSLHNPSRLRLEQTTNWSMCASSGPGCIKT
nr:unnamed protein product [Spirometra erinaceieuropaei]